MKPTTHEKFRSGWVAIVAAIDHPGKCESIEVAAKNFARGSRGKMEHVTALADMTIREVFELRRKLDD